MEHINNELLGRQIGEVFKWLCFLNYLCLKTDKRFASRLDDIQYILEAVSENKSRDISETAQWWEQYYEDSNCNEYASNLIKNVRNAGRESRLTLPAHKRKSLAFYFSEFRGLSISLKAARDAAEHHVSQGESQDLFVTLYGSIALRIFSISKTLKPLIAEIATANPEEVKRFDLRLRTASDQELKKYEDSAKKLPTRAILQDRAEKAQDAESSAQMLTAIVEESEDRVISLLQGIQEEVLNAVSTSKKEVLEELGAKLSVHSSANHSGGQGATLPKADHSPKGSTLDREELFKELLELRGRIYSALTSRIDGFEHWHNILQRPIIAEICRSGCRDYASVKSLPGFKRRIIQANNGFALKEQEEMFAGAIDTLLSQLKS